MTRWNSDPSVASAEAARTKAERLEVVNLSVSKCVIDAFLWFSVADWQNTPDSVLDFVGAHFRSSEKLIIRSSAIGEDDQGGSLAGALHSEWAMEPADRKGLTGSINRVIASFSQNGRGVSPNDQIIIQHYVTEPMISGVVLTWDLWHDRPYYVINYDINSKRTDLVTSGRRGEAARIFRGLDLTLKPTPWENLLSAVQEIEKIFPEDVIEAEFAIDVNGVIHIFQVRSLAKSSAESRVVRSSSVGKAINGLKTQLKCHSRASESLPGYRTVFTDMSDWNPAEILGARPNSLDVSLYRFLITQGLWSRARAGLGYEEVQPCELMLVLGDKPYIDARVCFNSLLPAQISGPMREEIVNCCIDALIETPALHDKVEFEIAVSCYDFGVVRRLNEFRKTRLTDAHAQRAHEIILSFTNDLVRNGPSIIRNELIVVEKLKQRQRARMRPDINHIALTHHLEQVLYDCREHGALPFARLARLAFVGMALLRSLVKEGIASEDFNSIFLRSLNTVTAGVHLSCERVTAGKISVQSFLEEYGHLRPSTYDITAPCYNDLPANFWLNDMSTGPILHSSFKLETHPDLIKIDRALVKDKLEFGCEDLFNFIKRAVEAREYAKFIFTRDLSDGLETIATCGDLLGFSREEMSALTLTSLIPTANQKQQNSDAIRRTWREEISKNILQKETLSAVAFPPVLCEEDDLLVVPYPEASPNFVTQKCVRGGTFLMSSTSVTSAAQRSQLRGKIVLMDNADPGYDWLFASSPKGLITKYGGAGSHMAVRCAEFGIPAAIGCGETLFDQLSKSFAVLLDCEKGAIVPI